MSERPAQAAAASEGGRQAGQTGSYCALTTQQSDQFSVYILHNENKVSFESKVCSSPQFCSLYNQLDGTSHTGHKPGKSTQGSRLYGHKEEDRAKGHMLYSNAFYLLQWVT